MESAWRELEARADASFFQSWSWIGCRVAERFDRPRLVSAWRAGRLVGLALFNRHPLPLAPRALWLHETGVPDRDSVFIEFNGPLVAHDGADAAVPILRTALRDGGTLVLSGVAPALLAGLAGTRLRAERACPAVALAGLDAAAWEAGLGASTRAQLRRSQRRLDDAGAPGWRRARDLATARADLAAAARLHARRWSRDGRPGAFAEPAFEDFLFCLLERCFERGEIEIATLAVGGDPVSILIEFHWRGRVLAYQSGIDLERDHRTSPGLVAHARSIADAIAAGRVAYEFLAGDTRHKRSLANRTTTLHWAEVSRRFTRRRLATGVADLAAALRRRFRTGRAGPH